MTAQIAEILVYSGTEMALLTTPLEPFLEHSGCRLDSPIHCSGLRRGYIGTWEIKANGLFLNHLTILGTDNDLNHLTKVFPSASGPVFANWFSGTLRVPKGRVVKRVHCGFFREYEGYLLVNVQRGNVIFEGTKGCEPQ